MRHEWLLDSIMVGLRRAEGVRLDALVSAHGGGAVTRARVLRGARDAIERGWLVRAGAGEGEEGEEGESGGAAGAREEGRSAEGGPSEEDAGEWLRLVEPDGFLFSNQVISSIFAALGDYDEEVAAAAAETSAWRRAGGAEQ